MKVIYHASLLCTHIWDANFTVDFTSSDKFAILANHTPQLDCFFHREHAPCLPKSKLSYRSLKTIADKVGVRFSICPEL